jgi:hypothetical protein
MSIGEAVEICAFAPGNAETVSQLVRQVLDTHVTNKFDPEGIEEVHWHVSSDAIAGRATTHDTLTVDGAQQVNGFAFVPIEEDLSGRRGGPAPRAMEMEE